MATPLLNNPRKPVFSGEVWFLGLSVFDLFFFILAHPRVHFLILSQRYSWNEQKASKLKEEIQKEAQEIGLSTVPDVLITSKDFKDLAGDWALWPAIRK